MHDFVLFDYQTFKSDLRLLSYINSEPGNLDINMSMFLSSKEL